MVQLQRALGSPGLIHSFAHCQGQKGFWQTQGSKLGSDPEIPFSLTLYLIFFWEPSSIGDNIAFLHNLEIVRPTPFFRVQQCIAEGLWSLLAR